MAIKRKKGTVIYKMNINSNRLLEGKEHLIP